MNVMCSFYQLYVGIVELAIEFIAGSKMQSLTKIVES